MNTDLILKSLPLLLPTDVCWTDVVLNSFDQFLLDHASCERKAYAAALMLVQKFQEYAELQDRMIGLAHEELTHFHQLLKILRTRDLRLGSDEVDPYVKLLLTAARHSREEHLLDRLMITAVIEARSCERFCLLAKALPEGDLKSFYENFSLEESRHCPMFVETAKIYFPEQIVNLALNRILELDANILPTLPLKPKVH